MNTVVIVHGCVPRCCIDNEAHASQSHGYMHYTLKYIKSGATQQVRP